MPVDADLFAKPINAVPAAATGSVTDFVNFFPTPETFDPTFDTFEPTFCIDSPSFPALLDTPSIDFSASLVLTAIVPNSLKSSKGIHPPSFGY